MFFGEIPMALRPKSSMAIKEVFAVMAACIVNFINSGSSIFNALFCGHPAPPVFIGANQFFGFLPFCLPEEGRAGIQVPLCPSRSGS